MHTIRAAAFASEHRRYRFTPNALVIDDARLPQADYERIGHRFAQIVTGVRWGVGDWILYGEGQGYYDYTRAQELTGLSYDSLSQSRRVAAAFPPAARVGHLSWSHHRAALALPIGERQAVLERARVSGWTAVMLLEFVAERRRVAAAGVPVAHVAAPSREPHRRKLIGWRQNRVRTMRTCPNCGHSWQIR